jgi:hydroxyacylglutathione hydrolase
MLCAMNIEQIKVGPYEVNCSILWGEAKQALIIDPGCDAEEITAILDREGLTVAAYLLTHGHADHISALNELYTARPAPIYLLAADEAWAFGANNQIPPHYSIPKKPAVALLDPTQELPCDGFQGLELIETPGHTPGGVCYWFKEEKICFTGDTLFKGSCGRTDLPGGDGRVLAQSLKKLAALPGDTRIVAGHGDDSTIAYELETNFFLKSH